MLPGYDRRASAADHAFMHPKRVRGSRPVWSTNQWLILGSRRVRTALIRARENAHDSGGTAAARVTATAPETVRNNSSRIADALKSPSVAVVNIFRAPRWKFATAKAPTFSGQGAACMRSAKHCICSCPQPWVSQPIRKNPNTAPAATMAMREMARRDFTSFMLAKTDRRVKRNHLFKRAARANWKKYRSRSWSVVW